MSDELTREIEEVAKELDSMLPLPTKMHDMDARDYRLYIRLASIFGLMRSLSNNAAAQANPQVTADDLAGRRDSQESESPDAAAPTTAMTRAKSPFQATEEFMLKHSTAVPVERQEGEQMRVQDIGGNDLPCRPEGGPNFAACIACSQPDFCSKHGCHDARARLKERQAGGSETETPYKPAPYDWFDSAKQPMTDRLNAAPQPRPSPVEEVEALHALHHDERKANDLANRPTQLFYHYAQMDNLALYLARRLEGALKERDLHYSRLGGLFWSGAMDALTGKQCQGFADDYANWKERCLAAEAKLPKWVRVGEGQGTSFAMPGLPNEKFVFYLDTDGPSYECRVVLPEAPRSEEEK